MVAMISPSFASKRGAYFRTTFTSVGTKQECTCVNWVFGIAALCDDWSHVTMTDEVALLFTGSPLQPVKNSAQDSESQADHLDTTQMDFSTGDIKPPDSIDGDAAPNMNMKAPPNPSLPTPVHSIHSNLSSPPANCLSRPLFRAEQLGIDRRLLVNRKRQLKMHRVWIQAKFVKLPSE
jgi:hypothetical protein